MRKEIWRRREREREREEESEMYEEGHTLSKEGVKEGKGREGRSVPEEWKKFASRRRGT